MAQYIEPDSIKEITIGEHDSTTTPTKKVLAYGWDSSGLQKVRLKVDANGIPEVTIGGTPITKTANYSAAQTDAIVWTPATGKKIILMGVLLSTDTEMTIEVESSNTDIIPPCYFAATGGAVVSGGSPLWKGAANATLTITSSEAGNHSIMLWGYEE